MTKAHVNFMGIDNRGETYHNLGRHPRKELLSRLGRKHADRIYVDNDGKVLHIGYIIATKWISLYKVEPFEKVV